jgi:hypothetical protein
MQVNPTSATGTEKRLFLGSRVTQVIAGQRWGFPKGV